MNNRKSIIITFIFVAIASLIIGVSFIFNKSHSPISRTFFTADTVCTITLYDSNQETLDSAVTLCNNIANKLNCYDPTSDISKLNSSKSLNNPDPYLFEAIKQGVYYSNIKDGIFDITVKPISELWNFKNKTIPSKMQLDKALKKIDYKNIIISQNSISLKNDAEIDLGALAKGYIAGKISDFLLKSGVKSAVINLGGNVCVLGDNNGSPFSVGIQTPFKDSTSATIKISNMSVVTSGIYQRYFEEDDIIYHHLLNTSTGMPVNNSLASVTIITKDTLAADPLSTLCFLLGPEEGMKFIEQLDGIQGVFIDINGNLTLSSGLSIDSSKIITIK